MLFLNPPYYVLDGHTLLPDHADPGLYYVIPPAPRLTVNEHGLPAFSLVQFLGGGARSRLEGGLLTFTVELPVADDMLRRLEARLKARLNAADDLRVVPVMWSDGVVELVALGAASAAAAPTPAGGGGQPVPAALPPPQGPFSVQFLGSGRPSLDGNNLATCQLTLDAAAAELLERALEAAELPVVVIYRLGLAGLRPSFQIDVKADWHKFYRSLQNKFDANVYYVTADAEVKVSEALESSAIHIDTAIFGVGEGAQAAADRARRQLIDWIFERLFQPMVDPNAALANTIGQVVDSTVSSLVRAAVPGVSYKLRSVEEDYLRTLAARMNESVAERRELVPQGTLGGLLQQFRLSPDGTPNPTWSKALATLVQKVNLDGFPRIEVTVAAEDRFASDGVSRIEVELGRLAPGGAHTHLKALTFRSAAQRESYAVNLLGEVDPRLGTPYQYRVTVHFDPSSQYGSHESLTTSWRDARTTQLFVEPRSDETYQLRVIQIAVTPLFSFSVFPAVSIELKAGEDGTQSLQTFHALLNPDKPQAEWRHRSFGPAPLSYRYRATFHRPAERGGDIQGGWSQASDEWLSIPDPLPRKRTLNIFVNLPWQDIAAAFIQLRYDDEKNGIHHDEQLDLEPTKRVHRRDIPVAEDGPRAISYRLTIFLGSGALMEGSWRETEDERLIVDRRLVDKRLIRVRSIGGTLRENHLAQVRLRLEVREPGREAVRDKTELRIQADETEQLPSWDYLVGDPPVRSVFYDVLFIDERGFTETVSWRATDADLLIVNLRNKTVSS